MIPKEYRLKESETIRALRSNGKSYASPITILVTQASTLENSRIAFLASRSVGGAVQRNRCKRVLRSRVARLLKDLKINADLLLIARRPLLTASVNEIDKTLVMLFERAKLTRI